MDWWSELSDLIDIRDKSFPVCDFDYEPEINYSDYVITDRERDLNEQACDQARRILSGEENTNLLKLEKDIIALENQEVLTHISWSESTTSVNLSERVKSIGLSIISLKNTNTDARISHESLTLQKELIGRWNEVLKRLPENYLPHIAIQDDNKLITEEMVLSSRQSETNQITVKKNVICSTGTVRKKDEVKEVSKSTIEELVVADINETSSVVKSDFILSVPETMKKEVEQEETKQPASDLSKDATKHEIASEVNNELRKIGLKGEKELSEKVKVAGQNSESSFSELYIESKEMGKDVSSSQRGNSFSETEVNTSDTLLEYYNHKRELSKMNSKDRDSKKAKSHHRNQKEIKVFKQKVNGEYELIEPNSAESVCPNILTISDTRMEEIPSAQPVKIDLQRMKLHELKEMAKKHHLKSFSKFTKSKLIQEINLKIMSSEKQTK